MRRALEGGSGPVAAGTRSRQVLAVAMALSLAAAACAGPAGEPQQEQSAVLPSLELVATIGCGECDGIEQLTPVSVDAWAGGVLLRDRHEPLVRRFSFDGEFQEGYGVEGQGPGDIEFVDGPAYAGANGEAYVYGLSGLQEFGAGGKFTALHRWPMLLPHSLHFQPSLSRLYVLASPPPGAGLGSPQSREVVRYDVGADDFGPHTVVTGPAMPFAANDLDKTVARVVGATPDGRVLLGDPEKYVLYWYSPSGTLQAEFGRDISRPKMTSRGVRARASFARQAGTEPDDDDTTGHFGGSPFNFDGQGRLWVQTKRWSESGDDRQIAIFDVFAPDDSFLGEVRVDVPLSVSESLTVIRGRHLVGVFLAEDGEARVGVWRIVEPG